MNTFIVSVGEVILRNIATKEIIAIGTSVVDSSFALTSTKTDVRAGKGNSIIFSYVSERAFNVTINQASFNKEILALNAGGLIESGTIEYVQTDCIELDVAGTGTLTKTPTGDVAVILPNNIKISVVPVGDVITVPDGESKTIYAAYTTSAVGESLLISDNTPPSTVDMIYTTEVRDETNVIVETMQIHVPKLALSGNYTLTFNANGIANEAIEGTALSSKEGGCGLGGGYYARVAWIAASGASITPYGLIAATPSDWEFSIAQGLPLTKQIEVLGIPNDGIRANANVTAGCTFAIEVGGDADITVSAGGLVTCAATATAGNTATVLVTHTASTLTDRCLFTVVA